jgi:hypothetical protein
LAIDASQNHAQDAFPYSGTVMVEEDSPGNYMLREREGRIEFVTFDALGGEEVMTLTE